MTLPSILTGDTATGLANGALLGSLVLALVLGTVLGFALLRSTGNTRKQSKRLEGAHMEVLRLRRILASSPRAPGGPVAPGRPYLLDERDLPIRPMPRPGPPAEPTQAFAAPDTTQRLRAYDGGNAT